MSNKIEVVYNNRYGGFGLSEEAKRSFAKKKGIEADTRRTGSWYLDIPRHDRDLVAVVKELGEKANGKYADLKIDTIEGDRYWIHEYDGSESVETPDSIEWVMVEERIPVERIPVRKGRK